MIVVVAARGWRAGVDPVPLSGFVGPADETFRGAHGQNNAVQFVASVKRVVVRFPQYLLQRRRFRVSAEYAVITSMMDADLGGHFPVLLILSDHCLSLSISASRAFS
jgi:hypothetical protein